MSKIEKVVVMMMGENIFGREIIKGLVEANFPIQGIIIEHSPRASKMIDYLKNDFYNPPSFSELITKNRVKVFEADNLNSKETREILLTLEPDLVLLGGSSRIIKPEIIETAKIGILNSHPGLLPRYRGMDVVGWAIYNGDRVGATCHFVDEGIDTGAILLQEEVPYEKGETLLAIRVRVMRTASALLVRAVRGLETGTLRAVPQTGESKRYGEMPPETLRAVEEKLRA